MARRETDRLGIAWQPLHGIRKSAVVKLYEESCTVPEIAAITGQSVEMVIFYTRDHDRVLLAELAAAKASQNHKDPEG